MTIEQVPDTLHSSRVLPLDEAECRSRLRTRTLGRIAVKLADDLVIVPVYYAVMDDDIIFRTAPGTKLSAAVLKTKVAFEVDDAAPGWSVLVRGHAEEIRAHDEQARADVLLGSNWPDGEREHIVRIRGEQITGRWLPPLP